MLKIEDLDLDTEMLPVTRNHPAAHTRLIFHNNRLHTLPRSKCSYLNENAQRVVQIRCCNASEFERCRTMLFVVNLVGVALGHKH